MVDVPVVLSVAQIGNSLRVLTDRNGAAAARIRGVLEEAGLQAGVDASTPNLEDVFVAATGGKADDERERTAEPACTCAACSRSGSRRCARGAATAGAGRRSWASRWSARA